MTAEELRNIVQKFTDRSVDVALERRSLLAEVHGQLLEVELKQKGGLIYCVENGLEELAEQWIIHRLGNLEILANRILEFIPEDNILVPIEAVLTGVVDSEFQEEPQQIKDIVSSFPDMYLNL
jgi:hypothetical protein